MQAERGGQHVLRVCAGLFRPFQRQPPGMHQLLVLWRLPDLSQCQAPGPGLRDPQRLEAHGHTATDSDLSSRGCGAEAPDLRQRTG